MEGNQPACLLHSGVSAGAERAVGAVITYTVCNVREAHVGLPIAANLPPVCGIIQVSVANLTCVFLGDNFTSLDTCLYWRYSTHTTNRNSVWHILSCIVWLQFHLQYT